MPWDWPGGQPGKESPQRPGRHLQAAQRRALAPDSRSSRPIKPHTVTGIVGLGAASRTSDGWLRTVLENTLDVICVLAPDGSFCYKDNLFGITGISPKMVGCVATLFSDRLQHAVAECGQRRGHILGG